MAEPTPATKLPTPSALAQQLLSLLERTKQPAEAVRAQLTSVTDQGAPTSMQIRLAFARAGRVAAEQTLPSDANAAIPIAEPLEGWAADQLARMAILLGSIEKVPVSEQVSLIETLFRTGSEREQQAVLRTLSFLPNPERYQDLAAEATRTNVVTVFAALACENPFPAEHLPDLNFNQMILKAIFMGVDTQRTLGLKERVTPELVRMLNDFAAERQAAGRPVPADIGRIGAMLSPPS